MPKPSKSQAAAIIGAEYDAPRQTSPAASSRFDADSTNRPPTRSMVRPTRGPSSPESMSEPENAAKNQVSEMPRSREIGSARIAGR